MELFYIHFGIIGIINILIANIIQPKITMQYTINSKLDTLIKSISCIVGLIMLFLTYYIGSSLSNEIIEDSISWISISIDLIISIIILYIPFIYSKWYVNYMINKVSYDTPIKLRFVPCDDEIIVKFYNPLLSKYCSLPTNNRISHSLIWDYLKCYNDGKIQEFSDSTVNSYKIRANQIDVNITKMKFRTFGDILKEFNFILPKSEIELEKLEKLEKSRKINEIKQKEKYMKSLCK